MGTGRRIAKTVTEGPNSQTIYYLNSDSALLAEANEAGQITKAYGFNPNALDAEEELWSTDAVWQADIHNGSLTSSQTRYHYITTDHLGTPILATDKSGNKTWRGYSQAFGHTGLEAGNSTQINLRFPGQYWDKETGLHQNFFRDYSPARGRYIQSDPLGIFWGLNTYEYANSDPLGYIDPTGEVPIAPIVWSYFRCVVRCTVSSSIMDALTGEVDCWPNTLTDNAQNCALSCANPLNWLGNKFNKAIPKPAKGKGPVAPAQRDKKRVWSKGETKSLRDKIINVCSAENI
ncbi:RHS repeat domain-containing protein [Vandammella animalimorsus]|uniref:Teneurin-like YD-shell domain-containing protein n=1 Tax=Vandammella animalimorsus TaxID=2029117 RepID=A0A2A2AJ14_9BURK|nr:RHS repeat-associated core domain-containing protein [Vandammella animalimorsus]PAT37816.1 hypothetical protein CK625_06035 [Vandammella animalimorsus]